MSTATPPTTEEVANSAQQAVIETTSTLKVDLLDTVHQVDIIQPLDWGLLIALAPAIAILISSAWAIRMAKENIKSQKDLAIQRGTIEAAIRIQAEPEYLAATQKFMQIRSDGTMLDVLEGKSRSDREDRYALFVFLNHYELLCLKMHERIIDERIFCLYYRGILVHHYHDTKEFIQTLQETTNENAYAYFKSFATHWDNDRYVTIQGKPSEQKRPKSLPASQDKSKKIGNATTTPLTGIDPQKYPPAQPPSNNSDTNPTASKPNRQS